MAAPQDVEKNGSPNNGISTYSDSKGKDHAYVETSVFHPNTGIVNEHRGELQRQMKARHIQMISIGGVIGTGLFIGSGASLADGGPLGLFLGYIVIGSVVFAVMTALGEMISQFPLAGGHITLARRFGDPALSFTMGWNYWYNWTIVLPAELSAAALLINFWITRVNNGVWITVFLVIVLAINLGGARTYAEFEFWFASIKIITIVGLIIAGIVITAGGGPNHQSIGFQYWRNPGPLNQYMGLSGSKGRFLGFFTVLVQASYSYIGTEITAITAGEAKNPRRNLPKAIKRVYVRIILFYLVGVFMIGLLVSPQDPRLLHGENKTSQSPWVIAIQNAGIGGLPSVVNAALLTSAWSAASSDMYTSSRALYSMAITGSAPKIFAKTTSWGLPWLAIVVSFLFSLLSYMNVSDGAGKVFGYFATMTSIAGLQTWAGILITAIQYYKGCEAQGIDRRSLPYRAPFQPWLSYYGLFICVIVVFFGGWQVFVRHHWVTSTFVTTYLPPLLFFVLYFGYKFYNRTQFVRPHEMDFQTGSDEAPLEEEKPPRNMAERFWRWLA